MTLEMSTSFNEFSLQATPSSNLSLPSCPPKSFTEKMLQGLAIDRWCLGLEFFFALFGNLCILVLLWKRREKWTKMQLFILHLAIADLLVAFFFILPEWLVLMVCGFHAGDSLCRLYKYMQIIGMYGSTFVLVAAAFDRYRAICHPMQSFRSSRKRVHLSVAAMWFLAAALATPQLFVYGKYKARMCGYLPWAGDNVLFKRIYVTWYLLVILIIPTLLLSYLYGMIAIMIMRNLSEKKRAAVTKNGKEENEALTQPGKKGSFAPRASSTVGISRAKIKTVKMTVVIVITYIVCWTPFFVVNMLSEYGYELDLPPGNMFQLLGSLNSCTNPWIYMCFSGNLCTDLRRLVCCIKKKPKSFIEKPRGLYANQSNPNFSAQTEPTEHTMSYSMDSPTLRNKGHYSEQLEMTELSALSA